MKPRILWAVSVVGLAVAVAGIWTHVWAPVVGLRPDLALIVAPLMGAFGMAFACLTATIATGYMAAIRRERRIAKARKERDFP